MSPASEVRPRSYGSALSRARAVPCSSARHRPQAPTRRSRQARPSAASCWPLRAPRQRRGGLRFHAQAFLTRHPPKLSLHQIPSRMGPNLCKQSGAKDPCSERSPHWTQAFYETQPRHFVAAHAHSPNACGAAMEETQMGTTGPFLQQCSRQPLPKAGYLGFQHKRNSMPQVQAAKGGSTHLPSECHRECYGAMQNVQEQISQ